MHFLQLIGPTPPNRKAEQKTKERRPLGAVKLQNCLTFGFIRRRKPTPRASEHFQKLQQSSRYEMYMG
jgi:hypothetical protein